ncbi:ribosomal protein L1 [Viridothelium virens]|uniref:Ribosomal protein L1 n=1 Tax=Viridothelium virens TaxID=1048519 RepID=A0A6A6HCW0_VIRVR|nr:ribosomal protein L1 [Viridothelium virens]
MASRTKLLSQLDLALTRPSRPRRSLQPQCLSWQQLRCASRSTSANAAKYRRKDQGSGQKSKKKKKQRSTFVQYDLANADQFSLCDAMRYIRAFEVGRPPMSAKYEVHVKMRTQKSGPTIRNRMQLPHPVKTDVRICVICPPDSKHAQDAKKAGASVVGEDSVLEAIKDGRIEFDRCICHADSLQKLNKANVGRILGPKGLMPSAKTGTVVKEAGSSVKSMVGGAAYREKLGVVRVAIGQLGFNPEEMQRNIKAFIGNIKKDMGLMSDNIQKEIHEVVLSSTNSPGFSLNGEFSSPTSPSTKELSTL